jgi:hypothetical protein
MVISYLTSAFELGSMSFKIVMIIFILVFGILLTYGIIILVSLDEYRQNKEELFQLITDVELKELNVLAKYKIFDRNIDVFFCEKGIAVRNQLDLRLVMYDDILKGEFLRWLDLKTVDGKIPHTIKFPLVTTKKIKYLFGGQSLKIILPMDDEKKKIIISKLREILQ